MEICIERDDPCLRVKKIIAILIVTGVITSVLGSGIIKISLAKTENSAVENQNLELTVIQKNSLMAVSNPAEPVRVKKIKVVVTAYSSTFWQTDDTPYTTASGKTVEQGIIANNKYSFGTEVRFPEIYGDKVFIVEDRMHSKKGSYHFDIWMDSYVEAKNFGVKIVEAEILEN